MLSCGALCLVPCYQLSVSVLQALTESAPHAFTVAYRVSATLQEVSDEECAACGWDLGACRNKYAEPRAKCSRDMWACAIIYLNHYSG